jgi:arylsulfatase A-like enzyme
MPNIRRPIDTFSWGLRLGSRGWLLAIALFLIAACGPSPTAAAAAPRPNILWITSEDHGPHLGCYGDKFASTPNVDRLARQGTIYLHVWSCAPVCAPARTTLISGLYAPSTGSEHMRSLVAYPAGQKMFPQYLREAGYYCTNNAKEDYNLKKPGRAWDESSSRGHWKNRGSKQPFFAVFNSLKSHESQIRARPHTLVHDPAKVRVPSYHPDTPEVRHDWAQYYDVVSAADADAGVRLRELEAAGLQDDTIVFYFADHGSGMPRSKRTPCDSGLHVPLVVYIPEKFRDLRSPDYVPGGRSERLVSFVDFGPTVLSLAGIEPPRMMQGHAFLGKYASPPQPYLFGYRGRMDELYDLARSVTDGRYVYVHNFMPHKIYGQHVAYMFQTPTTRVWRQLHDQGRLTAAQEIFWQTKPSEELYDLQQDPDEVHNLALSANHRETLQRFRQTQHQWELAIRDVDLLPEGEMHARSNGTPPYDLGHDTAHYPLERILEIADLASNRRPEAVPRLKAAARDPDSSVRYWALLGLLILEREGVDAGHATLVGALDDPSPYVRIVAAEAVGRYGPADQQLRARRLLIELADWSKQNVFVVMAALNALDSMGVPESLKPALRGLPKRGPVPDVRYAEYVPSLLQALR